MAGIHTNQSFAIVCAGGGGLSVDTFTDQMELLMAAARRVRGAYGNDIQLRILHDLICETLDESSSVPDSEPCPECREDDCDGQCMEAP